MASQSNHTIDYRPALHDIVEALYFNALINMESIDRMSDNFDGLVAAVGDLELGLAALAEAVSRIPVTVDNQPVIDEITARISAMSGVAASAKVAEDAEDGVPAETPSE